MIIFKKIVILLILAVHLMYGVSTDKSVDSLLDLVEQLNKTNDSTQRELLLNKVKIKMSEMNENQREETLSSMHSEIELEQEAKQQGMESEYQDNSEGYKDGRGENGVGNDGGEDDGNE